MSAGGKFIYLQRKFMNLSVFYEFKIISTTWF